MVNLDHHLRSRQDYRFSPFGMLRRCYLRSFGCRTDQHCGDLSGVSQRQKVYAWWRRCLFRPSTLAPSKSTGVMPCQIQVPPPTSSAPSPKSFSAAGSSTFSSSSSGSASSCLAGDVVHRLHVLAVESRTGCDLLLRHGPDEDPHPGLLPDPVGGDSAGDEGLRSGLATSVVPRQNLPL